MPSGFTLGRQTYLELAREEGVGNADEAVTALLANVPLENQWPLLSGMTRIVPPQPGSVLAQVVSAERDLAARSYAATDWDSSDSDSDSEGESDGAPAFTDAR